MLISTKTKLLSFVAVLLGIFSFAAFSQSASAVESLDEVTKLSQLTIEDAKKLGKVTYQDDRMFMVDFGNNEHIAQLIAQDKNTITAPQKTQAKSSVTGPGGTARINSSNDGRQIYWSVKPNTTYPWIFKGNVSLYYYSGRRESPFVGGAGVLGSSYSGVVYLAPSNGGYAELTGEAYATNGGMFVVLPDVGTAFG